MNNSYNLCQKIVLFVFIFSITVFFIIGICPLSIAEVNNFDFDIFCYENAQYALIGEVIDFKDSVNAKGYEHWDSRVVSLEVIETFKGGALPKYISVLFERADYFPNDTAFTKGKKFVLFLNPSLAYYYIPVLYGSVYDLTDVNISQFKENIAKTNRLLNENVPLTLLNSYGYSDPIGLKIAYSISGGYSPYIFQKIEITGNKVVTCEIQEAGKKAVDRIMFKLSQESLENTIKILARMDFFNINFSIKNIPIDTPATRVSVSYGNNRNDIEGFFETYTTDLTEYYLGYLSSVLNQIIEFAHTKIKDKTNMPVIYESPNQNQYSLEEIKSIVIKGELRNNFDKIMKFENANNLILLLIENLDFQDNSTWFQGESRVNIHRALRYLTNQSTPYEDDFIYNSNDEQIQEVISYWQKWYEKNS